MKLGNVEVEFSFTNTSNLKKLKEAYEKIIEKADFNKKNTEDFIQRMDNECNIARNFFDEVFGEGIAEKIFGKENDYEIIMDTLEIVMLEYEKQQNRLNEKYAKYNPNRVQRRNKK